MLTRTRRALAATALVSFVAAGAVSGVLFSGIARPVAPDPAPESPAAEVPVVEVDYSPIWEVPLRPIETKAVSPPPDPPLTPFFRVERAVGGLAYVIWGSPVRERRAAWLAPGDEIEGPSGDVAVLDRIEIHDLLALEGIAVFRWRGQLVTLRWKQSP